MNALIRLTVSKTNQRPHPHEPLESRFPKNFRIKISKRCSKNLDNETLQSLKSPFHKYTENEVVIFRKTEKNLKRKCTEPDNNKSLQSRERGFLS